MDRWKDSFAKYWGKYKYFALILAIGIILLTVSLPVESNGTEEETAANASEQFDLEQFEEQVCASLSAIDGVGRVQILLSLESGEEAVYASDVSQSSQTTGEQSNSENYQSTMSILSDGSYGEQPIFLKSNYPTFRGAVIICDGADNSSVQLEVTDAITSLCGISSDHISILKMSQ